MRRLLIVLFVFLLPLLCWAQNKNVKITLKNGTIVSGVLQTLTIGEQVTISVGGIMTQIDFSDIAEIVDAEINDTNPNSFNNQSNNLFPTINAQDILHLKSYVSEGNCVFIPTNSSHPGERAGQIKLKEYIQNWGYWTVVDKIEQCHFVLQYLLLMSGDDKIFLLIRPREYYNSNPHEFSFNMFASAFGGLSPASNVGVVVTFARQNGSPRPRGIDYEDIDINEKTAGAFYEYLRGLFTDNYFKDLEFWNNTRTKFFNRAQASLSPNNYDHNSQKVEYTMTLHENTYVVYGVMGGMMTYRYP